jgi:hypothetical protein
VVNSATCSGGGETNTANDTATDVTAIRNFNYLLYLWFFAG